MSIQHDWTKENGNIIILKLSNEEKESWNRSYLLTFFLL